MFQLVPEHFVCHCCFLPRVLLYGQFLFVSVNTVLERWKHCGFGSEQSCNDIGSLHVESLRYCCYSQLT